MGDHIRAANPTIRLIVLCVSAIGLAAILAGGFMVLLGSQGSSEINILGQHLSTANVGVACVFIGVVSVLLALRTAFKTVTILSGNESKDHFPVPNPDDPDYELFKNSKLAYAKKVISSKDRVPERKTKLTARPNMPFSHPKDISEH